MRRYEVRNAVKKECPAGEERQKGVDGHVEVAKVLFLLRTNTKAKG